MTHDPMASAPLTAPPRPPVPAAVAEVLPRWQDRRRAGVLTPPPLRELDGLAIDTPPRWRKPFRSPWYYNPVWRFFIFLILMATIAIGFVVGLAAVLGPESVQQDTIGGAAELVAAVVAYLVLVLTFEKRRPPAELAPRRFGGLFVGLAIGAGLILAVALVQFVLRVYHVDGFNPGYDWAQTVFLVGLVAGVAEEIMFRGVLFRLVEEGLGTWGALLISSAFFGFVHLGNDNATLMAGISIAIEAGLLLGVLYALTRSLWVVIGLHAAWNVVQGPVLGYPVSGSTSGGWLRTHVTGPEWLSGGPFGAEASIVALVLLTAVAIALCVLLHRRGGVISPAWVRRRRQRELLAATQTQLAGGVRPEVTGSQPTPDRSDPTSRPVS